MTKVGRNLDGIGAVDVTRHELCDLALVFSREQPVAIDSEDKRFGRDAR